MAELLKKTRIILVEPAVPENVGSVARAMNNLGLERLVIAGSPGLKDQPPARWLAVDSGHILDAATEVASFEEAVAGAGLVLGTTAHTAYETWRLLEPAEAIGLARGAIGDVAIVFGCERYGLSKALLRRCDQVLHLPTERADCSLNLAQAVLLVAWEWRKAALAPETVVRAPEAAAPGSGTPGSGALASAASGLADIGGEPLPQLGPEWPRLLEAAGAFKPHNREKKMASLRRLLSRVRMSPEEAATVRSIGSKLALYVRLRGKRIE